MYLLTKFKLFYQWNVIAIKIYLFKYVSENINLIRRFFIAIINMAITKCILKIQQFVCLHFIKIIII